MATKKLQILNSIIKQAENANKLNTDAGSATQPVYFSNGVPVNTTYTLGKSVPSDAKFTDTTYDAAGTDLGLVKSGGDVTITNGVITVKDDSHAHVIGNIDGLQDALDGKSATSHTHADLSGKIEQLETWSGGKEVSIQISDALTSLTPGDIGAATSGHNHDDKYDAKNAASTAESNSKKYTDEKIALLMNNSSTAVDSIMELADAMEANDDVVAALNTAVGTKANASDLTSHTSNKNNPHGVTIEQIGAAAASHGTHVSYSTTAPVMDGTASVGSASTVARSDHKHPTDTSRASASDLAALSQLVGGTGVSAQISTAIGKITPESIGAATDEHSHSKATASSDGLMSKEDKAKSDYTNIAYCTCTTAEETAAKVITVTGNTNWTLTAGSFISVYFSYTNSADNPTFNVNGTGAKNVYYGSSQITTSSLGYAGTASRLMNFVYDGTQYRFAGWGYDSNTTYTNVKLGQGYATCSTAAATVAKTASLSSYVLTTGGIVAVKFTNAVPAGATLNINSKGAKAIYHKGAAITADVIKAGDTATFIYSGQYHLISIDTGIQGPKGDKGDKGDTGATGATGADGKTPVRGTDYWTADDIATIKSYVDEAILGGAW